MTQVIQLDLLPMAYYNTLGFDKELIDYLDFVDDSIVDELILPLYKEGGRPPKRPITQFRAHYLYFIKPEITSYRHLERMLKNPKNQDYRNFIAAPSPQDVPSHNCMSDFRKKVGIERFYQIMFHFIAQALRIDSFLDTNLTSIDSRPLYANTAGPKRKRCNCQDKKSCDCPETFTDPDAAVGVQRNKTNMNRYFVGYRKHTIISRSSQGPVPLLSIVLPANVHDVDVLLPLVEKLKEVEKLDIEYLVADLGYYDGDKHIKALTEHDVIVTTGVKSNAVLPENVTADLQVLCQADHPLVWDGFDKKELVSWYKGDEEHCQSCLFSATCDKSFAFSYKENPLIFSPVPQGTELHKAMQKFRKQVELNFAQESNSLDSVMRHKKLPVRGLERVQIFAVMADMFRLIKEMLEHIRQTQIPKLRDKLLKEAYRQQLTQRWVA